MTELPKTITEALSQVSEPAKAYYSKFAAFTREYNILYKNQFDYEQFKNELPLIFELAAVGLITHIKVATHPPYADNDWSVLQESHSRKYWVLVLSDPEKENMDGRALPPIDAEKKLTWEHAGMLVYPAEHLAHRAAEHYRTLYGRACRPVLLGNEKTRHCKD